MAEAIVSRLAVLAIIGAANQDIWITSINPYTGDDWNAGLSMRIGAEIMLEEINNNPNVLPGYTLKVLWQDSRCNGLFGENIFLQNVFDKTYKVFAPGKTLAELDADKDGTITTADTKPMEQVWTSAQVSPDPIGILGSGCSGVSLDVANIAYKARWPMVSNSATRPILSDRSLYPNFFRTIVPDQFYANAWLAISKLLGQTSVVPIIAETSAWHSMGNHFVKVTNQMGLTMVGNDLSQEMPGFRGLQISSDSPSAAKGMASELFIFQQRVVILMMYAKRIRLILCEAHKRKFVNAVFMTMGWFAFGWWEVADTSCTVEQVVSIANYFIGANMMFWRVDMGAKLSCAQSMTAKEWQTEWFKRQGRTIGDLSKTAMGFSVHLEATTTADAVCMYAQMLHQILVVKKSFSLADLAAHTPAAYTEVFNVLTATDFEGMQGRVRFAPGSAEPRGSVILQQLHASSKPHKIVDIGSYKDGVFNFFGQSRLKFQLSGEDYSTGPAGATSIAAKLTSFRKCPAGKSIRYEDNTCVGCGIGARWLQTQGVCVCPAGNFRDPLTNGCKRCPRGSASNGGTVVKCEQCGPGTRSNLPQNATACRPCRRGFFQGSSRQTACDRCSKGKYGHKEKLSECLECLPGRYAGDAGLSECLNCSAQSGLSFYNSQHGMSECVTCPKGAECPVNDIGLYVKYEALEGWYYMPDEVVPRIAPQKPGVNTCTFCQCVNDGPKGSACLGANRCVETMVGPLCGTCKDSTAKSNPNDICRDCPSAGVLAILILLAISFVLGNILFQIGYFMSLDVQQPLEVSSVILKQLVNYSQMLGVIFSCMDFETSPRADAGFSWSEYISVLPLDLTIAVDCLYIGGKDLSVQYRRVAQAYIELPLFLVLALIPVLLVGCIRRRYSDRSWQSIVVPAVIISLFILHTRLTRALARTFRCAVFDEPRLVGDLSVTCSSDEHQVWQVLSALGLVIFSLGIPFAFFVVLSRVHSRMGSVECKRLYGFLYMGFEPQFYYFEAVQMLRRVMFELALACPYVHPNQFWNSMTLVMLLLAVSVFFFATHNYYKPYDNRARGLLDKLENASLGAITLTLVARCLMIAADPTHAFEKIAARRLRDNVVVWIVLGVHLRFYCLVVFGLFRPACLSIYHRWLRSRHGWVLRFLGFKDDDQFILQQAGLDMSGLSQKECTELLQIVGELVSDRVDGDLDFNDFRKLIELCCTESFLFREKNAPGAQGKDEKQRERDESDGKGLQPSNKVASLCFNLSSAVIDLCFSQCSVATPEELADPKNYRAAMGAAFTVDELQLSAMRLESFKVGEKAWRTSEAEDDAGKAEVGTWRSMRKSIGADSGNAAVAEPTASGDDDGSVRAVADAIANGPSIPPQPATIGNDGGFPLGQDVPENEGQHHRSWREDMAINGVGTPRTPREGNPWTPRDTGTPLGTPRSIAARSPRDCVDLSKVDWL